ncbi:MAG: ABC transporter substrate-binding protein [Rhodospirillaceae bacterium]|nr:ABC transporter substrate-binding protein [Rhodospirillaceae bacterium]
MTRLSRRTLLRTGAAAGTLAGVGIAPIVRAAPPTIRLGHGAAAEEQVWLLIAKPELGKNHGKSYILNAIGFPSSSKRAQALEAGAIDLAMGGANGVIFAAAAGVEGKMIASISRESQKGFSTSFYVKADSPIKSIPDMKGKVVGINGFNTSGHLWLTAALKKHNMTDKDVRITPVRFPAMAESLESGRVEVGMFPQPFAAIVEKKMKVRKLFDAKYGMPFDEELIVMMGKDAYLKKNAEAIRGLLSDVKDATAYYLANPKKARQLLIDAKMVRVTADVYLDMKDYYRDPTCRIDVDSLAKMQQFQIEANFQKKAVDVKTLVDLSYLGG